MGPMVFDGGIIKCQCHLCRNSPMLNWIMSRCREGVGSYPASLSFLFRLLDHYSCLVDRDIIMLESTSSIKRETQHGVKVVTQSDFWWSLEFSSLSDKGINYNTQL